MKSSLFHALGLALATLPGCPLATAAGDVPVAPAEGTNHPTALDLRLVPFPKSVSLAGTGHFSLERPLVCEITDIGVDACRRTLNPELTAARLPLPAIRRVESSVPCFRLSAETRAATWPAAPQEGAPEGYTLEVRPDGIVCAANGPAGLIHGLQTLCQLIRANRQQDTLPCLTIRDWPSLRWRGLQDDMTRGPSSTLDTLKFEAALASFLKLNLMTYYMEYQFAFAKHPNIGPADGSLTAPDLAGLVEFAKPLQVDILGNQQSFGHFGQILQHPEFAPLRETADILTPVREETYRLLDDLYSEVCPVLPFPWFNVCCDETYGLGTGPARELAAQIGVGGLYVRHMNRIHDLLRDRYHKRMMMWGDIILQHPANLAALPKDAILLSWGYDARPSFEDQILPFAQSGYEFFVCPGVSDWSRILPDFDVAAANIHNFVRDGAHHGALGMIDTDWEDDGEALKAVKWHADAWAAECAWNASATPREAFDRRLGAVLFGETGDHFGQAIRLLARTHRLPGMKDMFNSRFWERDFVPLGRPAAAQATASNLLAVVRPAIDHLSACRQEAVCDEHILDVFLFGARRMELIGRRMLDGVEAAQLYARASTTTPDSNALTAAEQIVRRNRDAHEELGRQFAGLWLSESKPYALDWTMARYTNLVQDFDGLLTRLGAARAALASNQPLPAIEEVGLARPEPPFRCVRPASTSAAPLASDSPWSDPSATHRLGLVVAAGPVDRYDLPVEVDLTVPADLISKPVRAFQSTSNSTPRGVPAQLEPLAARGRARLIALLPGALVKGTETSLQVYLGLGRAPDPLPTAARTTPATNAMQWLGNNQVRLLLGSEGAHLYRWEVKAAGNRDLTMPGETDWAGFGDINPHRNAPYELECRARGPALVEFRCSDPWGHSQTVRLYAGVSWVEVLLNEPSSLYWDFDDPKNFASDGPTPGTWLFSNGKTGPVGRQADGVPAQVKASEVHWGIKYNPDHFALGLVTPEVAAAHVIAPGAGAGGVGIENSPPVRHLVTYAGLLEAPPAETMNRLQETLDLDRPISVKAFAIQPK